MNTKTTYILHKARYDLLKPPRVLTQKYKINSSSINKYTKDPNCKIELPKPSSRSKLVPYYDFINTWLKAKQQRVGKRKLPIAQLHRELHETFPQYKTSIHLLRKYARDYGISYHSKSGFHLSLIHAADECQVDYGTVYYYNKNNQEVKANLLVVSFPNSSMGYCQIFDLRTIESTLMGLLNIFTYIGGIPRELWIDHDSCILSARGFGKKKEIYFTKLFKEFVDYYAIKVQLCNTSSPHEKDSVENKVAYLRNNLFVPLPHITDLDSFNIELLCRCDQLHSRKHFRQAFHVLTEFRKNVASFLTLPNIAFEPITKLICRADYIGRVTCHTIFYYLDPKYHDTQVEVILSYNACTIYDTDGNLLLKHAHLSNSTLQENVKWELYLPFFAKHPNSVTATPITKNFPHNLKYYLLTSTADALEELFRNMATICKRSDLATILISRCFA